MAEEMSLVPCSSQDIVQSDLKSPKQTVFLSDKLPLSHLIDALAYVDPISADAEQNIQNLIQEEMRNIAEEGGGETPDYLRSFPVPPTPHLDNPETLVGKEMQRKASGAPMVRLDQSRYSNLESPNPDTAEYSDYMKASQLCQNLLTHSNISQTNLSLMNTHAALLWKSHLDTLTKVRKSYEREVKRVRENVESFSKSRKLQQVEAGSALKKLEQSAREYQENNAKIIKAIYPLLGTCKSLYAECQAKELIDPEEISDKFLDEAGLEKYLCT